MFCCALPLSAIARAQVRNSIFFSITVLFFVSVSLAMAEPTRHGTRDEHLAEIAEILAAGLMRLRARKSSQYSADSRESLLDCAAHQSGHPTRFSSGVG